MKKIAIIIIITITLLVTYLAYQTNQEGLVTFRQQSPQFGVARLSKINIDISPRGYMGSQCQTKEVAHHFDRAPEVKASFKNIPLPYNSDTGGKNGVNRVVEKVIYLANNSSVWFMHCADYYAGYGSNLTIEPIDIKYELN